MEAVGFVELLAAPAAKRRWSDEAKGRMVGKGLAQDRLDLEPLFLRRDHARGQLQAQADLDARLAPRLGGDAFEPDEILAEADKMRFKLPHLFRDDLRRAL